MFLYWKDTRILKYDSPTGNWTRVIRVTGGYTNHYTIEEKCGEDGHRSHYLAHAKRTLYHLSYIPIPLCRCSNGVYEYIHSPPQEITGKKPQCGIEPQTFALQVQCSTSWAIEALLLTRDAFPGTYRSHQTLNVENKEWRMSRPGVPHGIARNIRAAAPERKV